MNSEEFAGDLASCLEKLRWMLAGYKAGGILDWKYTKGKIPEEPVPDAIALRSPPAVTRAEAGGREKPEAPDSGVRRNEGKECFTGTGKLEPASSSPLPTPDEKEGLLEIVRDMGDCKQCRLHSGRTNLVFGEGSARSGLVFVGEGPGFDEDQQGRPFVGRAGKLLDKMIHSLGLQREEVYICNVVKCRPPENRTPEADEIAACSPFLFRQIEMLRPRLICALGACAAQTLLGSTKPMWQLRGKIHLRHGIPLICTFHPAYLLRNSPQKAAAWQDLKEIIKVLNSD